MMIPLLLAIKDIKLEHRLPMSLFYEYAGISRQGFHQALRTYIHTQSMITKIKELVTVFRKDVDSRAGSRSLYYNLNINGKFDIGVSKFEELMSTHGLTLKPLRVRIITTKSILQSWNYPNLANGLCIDNITQLVVGDLTYLYINGKRYFLFCLCDVYSARIVGHSISTRMRAVDAMRALNRWIKLRKKENLFGCIHHTDGGSQYFSERYLGILGKINAQVSCARNCLQNGYAEQRNGLIKHHLLPTLNIKSPNAVAQGISRIIKVYNHDRKQQALGWMSPVDFEKKIEGIDQRPMKRLFNFTKN